MFLRHLRLRPLRETNLPYLRRRIRRSIQQPRLRPLPPLAASAHPYNRCNPSSTCHPGTGSASGPPRRTTSPPTAKSCGTSMPSSRSSPSSSGTGGEAWFTYNFPTWSIPVEFRGSVVVFTSILAFSRATRNARLWCHVGLMFYFFYIVDGWFCALFVAGMFLAELDILARRDELPSWITRFEPWKTHISYACFCIAMVLGGVPAYTGKLETLTEAPGWKHVAIFVPGASWDQKWIFLFWSAIMMMTAIRNIGWLKAFFETPFCLYLGKISFSLYLVHGPIIWTLGDRLYAATGWYTEAHETNVPGWLDCFPISHAGPLGLEPSFLLPHYYYPAVYAVACGDGDEAG